MRTFIPLLLCLGLLTFGLAQQRDPSVLAPAGTSTQGTAVRLEWTLGELAVRSWTTSHGLLTEGFHQPLLHPEVIPSEAPADPIRLTLAPNPASAVLTIRIESTREERVVIELWDLQGRSLRRTTANLLQEDLAWDLSPLPSATYLLSFRTEAGEVLRIFKVTKTQ